MTGEEFILALIAGLIPSLIWLWFWLREDSEQPEPRSLLAGCFLAGMLAVILAIPVEQFVASIISDPTQRYVVWAAIEEILKFAAVAAIALHAESNDEPIDAMIYCIAVALGFAALENAFFIMEPLALGEVAASIVTGTMRFIGATLVHTVSTALIGFTLGETFYRKLPERIVACIVGLVGAIAIHTSFNISIINGSPNDVLKTFGWVWGAVVILIVLFEEVKAVRPL